CLLVLDDSQCVIRRKLVVAVEHKKAGGRGAAEAVAAYLREAAFTTLNRFVALKMLEARGLVQECVSKGDQSSGFKEFTGLAPGAVALPDHGYRMYIESLFDEIGREVRVLFDRRDPASLLWPRRQALHDLLAILNRAELVEVWAADETVGWVYQYFNSQEERRAMRDVSQAPRNSHELAVRNQFFTPRYVVQFLTDNALGRIWYEMRKGDTQLVEQCQYLVRRPEEIFLPEGEEAPEQESTDDLSQEELLKQPDYIAHRPKKDPRDLKILDPACGSAHFLLYCFDLLVTIYEEAWADEGSPSLEAAGRTLRQDYDSLDALRRDTPGLILRHNLHGIDIDARCAQIAAFALWMRAQRAYGDFGVVRDQRPPIRRTNVVVAEPMPGERNMLSDFAATLAPPLLAQLVEAIFHRMTLAGEAGTLLRVEDEIRDAIRKAREQWAKGPERVQLSLFGEAKRRKHQFDVSGIDDDGFWEETEQRIYEALSAYATQVTDGQGFGRRLFANDTEGGLAFIDLCRRRYDVTLMNPPFGAATDGSTQYLKKSYPTYAKNIACAFVERALRLLTADGILGAITDRALYFRKNYRPIRDLLLRHGALLFADLGWDVMDGANVEAAAFVCSRRRMAPAALFADVRTAGDRGSDLRTALRDRARLIPSDSLLEFPNSAFAHWVVPSLLRLFAACPSCRDAVFQARNGMSVCDSPRFVRLWWEVPVDRWGWVPFAHGGAFAPYYRPLYFVVNWRSDGAEIKQYIVQRYPYLEGDPKWVLKNEAMFFRPGLTYGKRAVVLSAQVMPKGCIFSDEGQSVFPYEDEDAFLVLAFLNSRLVRYIINSYCGQHKHSGYLNALPFPAFSPKLREDMARSATGSVSLARRWAARREEQSRLFVPSLVTGDSLRGALRASFSEMVADYAAWLKQALAMDQRIEAEAGLEASDRAEYEAAFGPSPLEMGGAGDPTPEAGPAEVGVTQTSEAASTQNDGPVEAIHLPSYQYGIAGELALRTGLPVERLPRSILSGALDELFLHASASTFVGLYMGFAFGRWDVRFATGNAEPADIGGSFERTPDAPPGVLEAAEVGYPLAVPASGILVDDPGHADDVIEHIREVLRVVWQGKAELIYREAVAILDPQSSAEGALRPWFRKHFFSDHIRRCSKSHRKAPIYWELAAPSGSYAVWLYYHRLTGDTFYKVLSDCVEPKLSHEERKLSHLRVEAGPNPTSSQRREIDTQGALAAELRAFQVEVERIAPLWNPDLNDGVLINFAPLWRLVRLRSWQRECKKVWDKLVKGDYDWSHLAMHLWPERVVPKCTEDRSFAIAHGLEEALWEEDEDGKWQPKEVSDEEIQTLVDERTSPQVKAALDDLLAAPAPATGGRRRQRRSKRS
ncbi:BREX-1 system adenine-specific DNA-methyltransferase PglX, partial [Planctomycetota bacterium]